MLGADGSISSVSGATTFWTLNADGSGSVGSGGLSWDTQGNIIGNFVELYNNGDLNVAGDIFATGSVVAGATNGIAPTDLPVATDLLYGVVKLDGATIKINPTTGKIYAEPSGVSSWNDLADKPANLTALAALAGAGIVKRNSDGSFSIDTSVYLTAITKTMVEAVLTGTISTHNHSGTYQPADADLTAIAGLTGTSGMLKKNRC